MKTLNFKIILALFVASFSTFAFTGGNPVHFDKTEFDFGSIVQGTPQKVEFTVTNESDQPLILKKVKGSCGCTATDYDTNPIAPGASTTIEATYNAKSLGSFRKTVSVYTNIQENPFVLTIKGTVITGQS
ncbi:MAG: DUF1573 domain-containing protein [Saprospiraceae bacterium]|nr:DUF1573 domain-containing protein [Saprospiraceae bacterium]